MSTPYPVGKTHASLNPASSSKIKGSHEETLKVLVQQTTGSEGKITQEPMAEKPAGKTPTEQQPAGETQKPGKLTTEAQAEEEPVLEGQLTGEHEALLRQVQELTQALTISNEIRTYQQQTIQGQLRKIIQLEFELKNFLEQRQSSAIDQAKTIKEQIDLRAAKAKFLQERTALGVWQAKLMQEDTTLRVGQSQLIQAESLLKLKQAQLKLEQENFQEACQNLKTKWAELEQAKAEALKVYSAQMAMAFSATQDAQAKTAKALQEYNELRKQSTYAAQTSHAQMIEKTQAMAATHTASHTTQTLSLARANTMFASGHYDNFNLFHAAFVQSNKPPVRQGPPTLHIPDDSLTPPPILFHMTGYSSPEPFVQSSFSSNVYQEPNPPAHSGANENVTHPLAVPLEASLAVQQPAEIQALPVQASTVQDFSAQLPAVQAPKVQDFSVQAPTVQSSTMLTPMVQTSTVQISPVHYPTAVKVTPVPLGPSPTDKALADRKLLTTKK